MANPQRRLRLYESARAAIGALYGEPVPGYVCPLCLEIFSNLDDLTEEHVPPACLGGKVLCLTCRECNSVAGHTVDAEAHREHVAGRFLATGDPPRRAKIRVDGLSLNVDVSRNDGGIHIQILGDQNAPETVKALQSRFPTVLEAQQSFDLQDSVAYRRVDADVSYLRAAYLVAFAKLGYAYILSPSLDRVRRKIQDPGSELLPVVRIYCSERHLGEKAILLAERPATCLAVKFSDSVVCLPAIGQGDGFYEELAVLRSGSRSETWHFSGTMRWPERFEAALDTQARTRRATER